MKRKTTTQSHDPGKMLKRNVLLFYVYQIFSTPGWVMPIIFIFFTEVHHLNKHEALSVLAFLSLFTAILEVPTGIVADKYSKRLSVALGMIVMSVGVFTQYYFASYRSLIFSAFLIGLGQSFRSGADQALIYDSLKGRNKTHMYGNIIAQATIYQMLATGLTVYLSGFLATMKISILGIYLDNYLLLFGLSAFSIFLSGVFALFMIEPSNSLSGDKHPVQSYTRHLIGAIRFILRKRSVYNGLFVIVVFGGVIRALAQTFGFILQPILVNFGYTAKGIATLSTLLLTAFGGGYLIYTALKKKYSPRLILTNSTFLLGIVFFIWTTFYVRNTILVSTILSGAFISIALVASQQLINDRTNSHYRTTVLSIVSLVARIYSFYLPRIAGWSFELGSYRMAIGLIGVFVLIALLAFKFGIHENEGSIEAKKTEV